MLEGAIGQMKAILRGSEDNAIATFNASHRSIKDAIKRAAELEQALTEPRLARPRAGAGGAQDGLAVPPQEPDVSDDLRAKAAALEDLLARETFYRELPAIEQHASAIEAEYARRFDEALEARIAAYTQALDRLAHTPAGTASTRTSSRSWPRPSSAGRRGIRSGCRSRSSARSWMPARADFRTPSRSFAASSTASVSRR